MQRGPFTEPVLGLGRDVAVSLRSPTPRFRRGAALAGLLGVALGGVGALAPLPLMVVLDVLALGALGVATFGAALVWRNRDHPGLAVHLDRSRLEVPRFAVAGPRQRELPLADIAAIEVAGGAVTVRAPLHEVRIVAEDLEGGVTLEALVARIRLRAALARGGGRMRRSTLLAAEAMLCLSRPEAAVRAALVEKTDGRWTLVAIGEDPEPLRALAVEHAEARVVTAEELPRGVLPA